jgi:RNA-binding protein 26
MFLTEEVKIALQKYLTITLEPITHSPPELLATYVIAIINNKDKSNEELRAKCENLLETFLFSSTKPFVAKFFDLLQNVDSPTFVEDLYKEIGVESKDSKKEDWEPSHHKSNKSYDSNHSEEEVYHQKRESTPEDEPTNIVVTKKQRVSDYDSRSTNNSREEENRNRDSRRDTKVNDRRTDDDGRSKKPSKDSSRDRYDPSLDPMDVRSQPGRTNPISTLQSNSNKYNPNSQGEGRIRQCYNFFNRGFCEKGANCQYYHGEHMEMDLSELEQLKRRETTQQPMVYTPLTPVTPVSTTFVASQDQKSHYFQQEKMNQFNPYVIVGNNTQNSNGLGSNNSYVPPSVRNSKHNDHNSIQLNKESDIENIFAPPENINEYKPKSVNTFPLSRVRVDTSLSTVICLLGVPHKDNSISKLDEHFNKFGTIVNIEVIQNEKKAKIKFSSHREAHNALKSPEAVFGNRFIKVLWNEQVDSSQVSLVNLEEKKLEEERKAEEEKKKEELRKAEQKKAEERRTQLLLERQEAAKRKAADHKAKPDLLAKSTITKKRTDLISAKKKLLDQMIETLKKPELPLEKKQQMLKEVEALKNTIKDDLTKLSQEAATLTPVVPTPKPASVSPKKLSSSIDTGVEGDQDLNIIADELSNLTKKAEQLGVFHNKPARGRGRGRGGFLAASVAPKRPSHLSVDRRPTAIKLTGMPAGNLDESLLIAHFSKFGTVQSVNIVGNDAIVKMEVRYQAENALRDGMVINQHKARGLWYVPEEVKTIDVATNNFEPQIETAPENETIENAPETETSVLETTEPNEAQVDQKDETELI